MSFDRLDVWKFDDRIDPERIVNVLKEIQPKGFNFGWHSNKGFEFSHWNMKIGGSKTERFDMTPMMTPAIKAVWDQVYPLIFARKDAQYRPIRCYVNAMTFGTEGYPHTDSKIETDLSVVVYLNPEWKHEWAGETVFFDDDDDIVASILPRFGRVSIFPGAMEHAARGVSRVCPEARYVLVFKVACE